MKDFIETSLQVAVFLVVAVSIIGVALFVLMGVFYPFGTYDCKVLADGISVDYKYNAISGCYLELEEGVYINSKNYIFGEIKK